MGCSLYNLNNKGEKMSEDGVSSGDTVKVNYTGSFENGEVFDSSIEEIVPLSYTIPCWKRTAGFSLETPDQMKSNLQNIRGFLH